MTIPQKLIDFVSDNEGYREKAYQDITGKWTVGYGTTQNVTKNTIFSKQEAEESLTNFLQIIWNNIKEKSKINLTENEMIALCDFAYNLGISALFSSHLWSYLQEENKKLASDEFVKWCHAGNIVVIGLLKRRQREQQIFNQQ